MIIFVHIQKTSGSSINHILKNQKKYIWFSYKKKGNLPDILSGHVPYGIHRDFGLNEEDVRYFTFLRDPISRWKSQFYHGASNPVSEGYSILKNNDFSLEKVLRHCLKYDMGNNLMIKQISGIENISNISRDKDDPKNKKYFGYYQMYGWGGRINKNSHRDMEEMLEIAKYNILNKFEFIGFQDRAKQCHIDFCKKFGFDFPKKEIHLGKRRLLDAEIKRFNFEDPVVKEMLLELNKYDISLYRHAIQAR